MDDDPDDPTEEILQQFRQLLWAVPISRDHMLKVVAGMPPYVREHIDERAQRTAEQLTAFWTDLQELNASLPVDIVLPASLLQRMIRLRLSVEGALREVDLLVADLYSFFGESADPKTCN